MSVRDEIVRGAAGAFLEEAQHAFANETYEDTRDFVAHEDRIRLGDSNDLGADEQHAYELAEAFVEEFATANAGKPGQWTELEITDALFTREVELGAQERGRETSPENFGHYLVMERMGHGVGWWEFRSHDLAVPNIDGSDWQEFPGMREFYNVWVLDHVRPGRRDAKRAKKEAGRKKREKNQGPNPWFNTRKRGTSTHVPGVGGKTKRKRPIEGLAAPSGLGAWQTPNGEWHGDMWAVYFDPNGVLRRIPNYSERASQTPYERPDIDERVPDEQVIYWYYDVSGVSPIRDAVDAYLEFTMSEPVGPYRERSRVTLPPEPWGKLRRRVRYILDETNYDGPWPYDDDEGLSGLGALPPPTCDEHGGVYLYAVILDEALEQMLIGIGIGSAWHWAGGWGSTVNGHRLWSGRAYWPEEDEDPRATLEREWLRALHEWLEDLVNRPHASVRAARAFERLNQLEAQADRILVALTREEAQQPLDTLPID